MAIKVNPGRARVNLKIWTNTMSIDSSGAHMSEEAALVIYTIALEGALPWAAELATMRALIIEGESAETTPERRRLVGYELTSAQATLALKVAACGVRA